MNIQTDSALSSVTQLQSLADASRVAQNVRAWMTEHVKGRDEVIDFVLIALFGDGHILLEDYPGSGKTTLANALGKSIAAAHSDRFPAFRRVQFTPDLLPSDVTGVVVFDPERNDFQFRPGPVFSHVLLVDEINRTTPKVQSALLEAMAEKQVTVDNTTHKLDSFFFVIATQNPLDAVGTYPLPTAQLDRFLFKIKMTHIDREAELDVLRTWGLPRVERQLPQVSRDQIVQARRILREQVTISPLVQECLVDIATALRSDKRVIQGVSTRSLVLAMPALQARAMLQGRNFVTPEDIKALIGPLFSHRLELVAGIEDVYSFIAQVAAKPLETLASKAMRA